MHDRVFSVSGGLEGVAKVRFCARAAYRARTDGSPVTQAYQLVAQAILQNPLAATDPTLVVPPPTASTTSIRLLVSHNLMGSIIGKSGSKIKEIQDASGVRMVASKEMLPQSTERIVEVQGSPDAIKVAVNEIGKCLMDDWERASGTVLYQPGTLGPEGVTAAYPGGVLAGGFGVGGQFSGPGSKRGGYSTGAGYRRREQSAGPEGGPGTRSRETSGAGTSSPPDPSLRTQNISIPSDMVGVSHCTSSAPLRSLTSVLSQCIIGKGGQKINEIRRLSGSRISIAKTPHDESGERMFTITGTPEANEKALFLLYNQLGKLKQYRARLSPIGSLMMPVTCRERKGAPRQQRPRRPRRIIASLPSPSDLQPPGKTSKALRVRHPLVSLPFCTSPFARALSLLPLVSAHPDPRRKREVLSDHRVFLDEAPPPTLLASSLRFLDGPHRPQPPLIPKRVAGSTLPPVDCSICVESGANVCSCAASCPIRKKSNADRAKVICQLEASRHDQMQCDRPAN